MRQGSILAFLQAKNESKDSENASSQVRATETNELNVNLKSEAKNEVIPFSFAQSLEDAQIVRLNDPRASIVPISSIYIDKLKNITTTLFPVRYSDKFFKECLEPEKSLTVACIAMYDARPVGWIRCIYEPFPSRENEVYQQLYIQVIGILAPFRGLGLAKALLDTAVSQARRTSSEVRNVYAHVWEQNEDALLWYQRQGFGQVMLLPQYYRKLKPAGAWIVRREVT